MSGVMRSEPLAAASAEYLHDQFIKMASRTSMRPEEYPISPITLTQNLASPSLSAYKPTDRPLCPSEAPAQSPSMGRHHRPWQPDGEQKTRLPQSSALYTCENSFVYHRIFRDIVTGNNAFTFKEMNENFPFWAILPIAGGMPRQASEHPWQHVCLMHL